MKSIHRGRPNNGGEPFRALMASPVDAPRNRLRDVVRLKAGWDKRTGSPEYTAPGKGFDTDMRQRFPHTMRTVQKAPQLFESGFTTLPGMEAYLRYCICPPQLARR